MAESVFENEARKRYGPPDVRAEKNRQYVDDLVKLYSEPVIRGLLTALSRLERPLCAHWLAKKDLVATPLGDFINPFEILGRQFRIISVDGDRYTVEISMGYDMVGDGGRFILVRNGDIFVIEQFLEQWIC